MVMQEGECEAGGSGFAELERIVAPTASESLARLLRPDLMEKGSVIVVAFDAVRAALGAAWPRRREQIWEKVDHEIARRLGARDLWLRVSDTEYLLAFTESDAPSAQAAAFKLLNEVLCFFLGSAERADMKVHAVTGEEDGELLCRPLKEISAPPPRPAPAPQAAAAGPCDFVWRRVPIVTVRGRPLVVRCRPVPLVHVGAAHGEDLRLERQLIDPSAECEIGRGIAAELSPLDHAAIDVETLNVAAALAAAFQGRRAAVLTPVSLHTLTHSKARLLLQHAAGKHPDRIRRSLLGELLDVAPGTPHGPLLDAVALMRPLFSGLVGRTDAGRASVELLRGCRLLGLSVEAADLGRSPGEVFGRLRLFAQRAHGAAPALIGHGLDAAGAEQTALAAGLTHYSRAAPPEAGAAAA